MHPASFDLRLLARLDEPPMLPDDAGDLCRPSTLLGGVTESDALEELELGRLATNELQDPHAARTVGRTTRRDGYLESERANKRCREPDCAVVLTGLLELEVGDRPIRVEAWGHHLGARETGDKLRANPTGSLKEPRHRPIRPRLSPDG
jgi:hypothetical protein